MSPHTCPANGTVPREAPLITASGQALFTVPPDSTSHFLPLALYSTLRIPSSINTDLAETSLLALQPF